MTSTKFAALCGIALAFCAAVSRSNGVTAYIPLNLEPEMERQIERVLILANEPILKRPFAVALVEMALPEACRVDKPLCERVRKYLDRYGHDYAVTHASVTGSLSHGAHDVVPNSYGLPTQSKYEISALGYVQPSDYLLASVGGVAYQGRVNPVGSMVSFGTNWAQLDLGYRPHWLSPMTDSSTLISTESPTTPSLTLSNYEPLGSLGFQYEMFWTTLQQASYNSGTSLSGGNILYSGVLSRGNPHLFGTQLSIEPFSGWSLGVNRTLEYGGGSGLPSSIGFLARDFFKPSGLSQTQGNQEASYISRFTFPGPVPFAVYFQYAGEDNSDGGSYLLGSAAMSAGIDFPRIGRYFDLTYEISEWQNIWYVHNIFLDGMSSYGLVLGNWGADQRRFNDGVGARSQMLRIGWEPPFGGYLETRARMVANETYYGGDSRQYSPGLPAAYPYHHYYDFSLTYSREWNALTVGGEALVGRDIFGENFSRLSGFVRYGGAPRSRSIAGDDDVDTAAHRTAGGEWFVDAGVNMNQVKADLEKALPITSSRWGTGPHVGIGARRAVTDYGDLGVRVEFDQVQGHGLIGLRPLDWRYRITDSFAVGAFAGVARYDLATPAYSMYAGLGTQWINILPKIDLGVEYRYAQNVARDHVLASDPQGVRPDSFYKIQTGVLYLSRHF